MGYDKNGLLQVRQKVGLVFQNPDDQLFAPTVAEDVAFGPLNMNLEPDEVQGGFLNRWKGGYGRI